MTLNVWAYLGFLFWFQRGMWHLGYQMTFSHIFIKP